MPEQAKDSDEQQPAQTLDLKRFTMNEVFEDRARDPGGSLRTLFVVFMWVAALTFVAYGAYHLKSISGLRLGGELAPAESERSRASDFEQSVINRSPVLMMLVQEVNLGGGGEVQYLGADGQIHQVQVDGMLQASLNPTASGPEGPRATTEKDWQLAGNLLMERYREFSPGQQLAVLLQVEGKPIGNLVYLKQEKRTVGVLSSKLAAPPPSQDHDHGEAGHMH